MIGTGNRTCLKIAYDNTAIVHDMIDLGTGRHRNDAQQLHIRRVGHMESASGAFARIQEARPKQIPETGMIPYGVEIPHQHILAFASL